MCIYCYLIVKLVYIWIKINFIYISFSFYRRPWVIFKVTLNIWVELLYVNRVIYSEYPAHISIFSAVSFKRPLTCVWKHTVQSANSIQASTNYLSKAPSAFPSKTLPLTSISLTSAFPRQRITHPRLLHSNLSPSDPHMIVSHTPISVIPSGMKTFSKKGRYEKCVKCVFLILLSIKLYCDKFVGSKNVYDIKWNIYCQKW